MFDLSLYAGTIVLHEWQVSLLTLRRRSCFSKYVHTKVVKRMETFRTKYAPQTPERTLLLPLSFGVSSTTLLQVLDCHLDSQLQRSGRAAYALHVLHVDSSSADESESHASRIEAARQRFPRHTFSSIKLSKVMDQPEASSLLPRTEENEQAGPASKEDRLANLLSSATSPTARTDILHSLQISLIVQFAKTSNCHAVLWADSTTRLAEKTLAETAKGRGFALPYITAEDDSVHGIRSQYPLRDILKKELVAYAEYTVEPPLTELVVRDVARTTTVSAKKTTIDALMMHYFESVEKEYPSIVANVVRTAGKLETPMLRGDEGRCRLCSVPVQAAVDRTEMEGDGDVSGMCSTCARSLNTII